MEGCKDGLQGRKRNNEKEDEMKRGEGRGQNGRARREGRRRKRIINGKKRIGVKPTDDKHVYL